MASYSEMITQIEELKKQAERQRKEEYSSVLKTIKKQIADYGITLEDLNFGKIRGVRKGGEPVKASVSPKRKSERKAVKRRANAGIKVPAKYRDEAGNTWTGRGKQPKWLVEALASGRSLESLIIPS